MGTTLENGVYLPSEGERNCYAGLKTNWEILDQKVADVTALQQAVAGALHREIVESLPTTDIDPNTIYMILSGTSATENVYNEFMYVNNAWELIGTSATDLTNYYTKAEIDGKLLLKANASDLTSHTGDTTIHVTTADKSKWNNGVSQSYVLRYSSASVTDNSTVSYSTLDNTDNIKSGDKVIDVNGKIFSVVSVDTANQTVTVGSALIDLALDSNVMHLSGNETVAGLKTWSDNQTISSASNKSFAIKNTAYTLGESTPATNKVIGSLAFKDSNNENSAYIDIGHYLSGEIYSRWLARYKFINGVKSTSGTTVNAAVDLGLTDSGNAFLRPYSNGTHELGTSSSKWKDVQTNQINGLTPSSLGMPQDRSARIDISSYITNLGNGDNNQYIVPANGYIWLHFTSINSALCYSQTSGGLTNYAQTFVRYSGEGQLYAFFPVRNGDNFVVRIYTSSTAVVQNAYFIPCQGNV